MSETIKAPPPQEATKKRSQRSRRPKKLPTEGSASPVAPATSQQRNRHHQHTKDDDSKPTPKMLEITKLIKKFHPLSVNGTHPSSLSVPLLQVIKNSVNEDIYFVFEITPSDPDFPFELQALKFSLFIPLGYPFYQYNDRVTRPSIVVLNKDIPRGYSVNIEIGFNEIIDKCMELKSKRKHKRNRHRKKKTMEGDDDEEEEINDEIELVQGTDLSSIIVTLDKYLERFLSREKKDTIKIVRHKKQQQPNSTANTPPPVSQEPVFKRQTKIEVPEETLSLRNNEVHKFLQRLQKQLNIKQFKSTQFNDVYSLRIPLTNELCPRGLDIEVGPQLPPLKIDKLPCRLHVPTDYLFNKNKPIKLEVDKVFMIDSVSQYEDSLKKLEISTRINKLFANFNDIVSMNFLTENLQDLSHLKHSITSQLNFFVYNCKSLMDENFEFTTIQNL